VLYSLKHFDWQLLRYMVRAEAARKQPFGRELRIYPTRLTKDGTFLDDLVKLGLIAVAGKPAPVSSTATAAERNEPVQFRTRYTLTEKGRKAAEYGEYEVTHTPAASPLSGLAAEFYAQADKRSDASRGRTPEGKARKMSKK
jgi:hypothetical protein